MNYFIDTNIIIYALKNSYPSIIKKFENTPSYNIFITSIVKAEIDYGIAKSKSSKLTRELYNKFLSIYNVIPFTEKETKIYGDIRYQLEKEGKLIGANDMLIAAIVMSHNGILITHNVNEFSRIKGLQIEDWTEN